MGRHELYAELPFVAVLGLQKQERRLSMAWSNAAALLEDEELETNALITSDEKTGMEDPKNYEKDERVHRMSVILLDDLEGTDGVYLTLPLVVAVMIASMFAFNGKVVHIPVLSLFGEWYFFAQLCLLMNIRCTFPHFNCNIIASWVQRRYHEHYREVRFSWTQHGDMEFGSIGLVYRGSRRCENSWKMGRCLRSETSLTTYCMAICDRWMATNMCTVHEHGCIGSCHHWHCVRCHDGVGSNLSWGIGATKPARIHWYDDSVHNGIRYFILRHY